MIYKSIIVTRFCFTDGGPLKANGITKGNITFAYHPDAISTLGCSSTLMRDNHSWSSLSWMLDWVPINYNDLLVNKTSLNSLCDGQYPSSSNDGASEHFDIHHPIINVQQDLRSLDPAWKSCLKPTLLWDPPRTLNKVSAFSSMPQPVITSTIAASPELRMSPSGAASTVTVTHPTVSNLHSQDTLSLGSNLLQTSSQGLQPLESSNQNSAAKSPSFTDLATDHTATQSPAATDSSPKDPSSKDPSSGNPAAQNPSSKSTVTRDQSFQDSVIPNLAGQSSSAKDSSSKHTILSNDKSSQTAADDGLLIAESSIAVEDQTITFEHIVAVGSSNSMLDGSTHVKPAFPNSDAGQDPNQNLSDAPSITPLKTFVDTAAGHTFTTNQAGAAIVSTTISAGGAGITLSGTLISILPNDKGILVGSSTMGIPTTMRKPLTVADIILPTVSSGVTVNDDTLSGHGQAARISGTVISLDAGMLQIGSSTNLIASKHGEMQTKSLIDSVQTASKQGLGAMIMSAYGAGTMSTSGQLTSATNSTTWNDASTNSTSSSPQFMGKGFNVKSQVWTINVMMMLCTTIWVLIC